MAMELGGWVLEEAGDLEPVLAVAVVGVGGEEELGAFGGANGALGGGVHSPDADKAWGRREERSGSRSSACPLSRAVLPGLAAVSADMVQGTMGASAVGTGLWA